MPLGTISHVKRSAAHTAMLILNGGLSRPASRICRMLSSQSHPEGTGLHEPESRGPRKFCAAVPEGWLHNGDLYLSCESSGESAVISSCSLLRFHWQKTKSTFVGSHAALSSQRGLSHVKLHFIVSVEHISPSERKGYFLHRPPLTTTSARFYHVLEREDEAKKKKKGRAASRKTTSHSRPASESKMFTSRAITRLLCGQAPSPVMIHRQKWCGKSSYTQTSSSVLEVAVRAKEHDLTDYSVNTRFRQEKQDNYGFS